MAKTYIEQLQEKAGEVFNETKAKEEKRVMEITSYSTGFTYWLNDSTTLINPSREIISDALLKTGIIFEQSVFIAFNGIYTTAISELRRAFDDFLTRVYFDIMEKEGKLNPYYIDLKTKLITSEFSGVYPKNAYAGWSDGDEKIICPLTNKQIPYPYFNQVLEKIAEIPNIASYDSSFSNNAYKIHRELSKYTHNRPPSENRKTFRVTEPIFNFKYDPEDFNEWYQYIIKTYLHISTILLLLYPEMKKSDEYSRFKKYFPEESSKIETII